MSVSKIATCFAAVIISDFNDDGETTIDDLPDFLSVFGKAAPRYDLDGDGTIGFGDFLKFAEALNSTG
jgi:Ca2+-binding EF-hand superfamily protein